ncbi:MAG: hypothetical protein JW986_07005 [Methanotrichaceae archaeon]|nr:hypothetical protein [Methanotrichaceae archaeon]
MSRCIDCKGKGLCGRPICPILRRSREISSLPPLGTSLAGETPPEVLVGHRGYPMIWAGPLIPATERATFDHSALAKMDVGEVVALRSALVRSNTRLGVSEAKNPGRLLSEAQEIAMSSRPVSTEVLFHKPPRGVLRFDGVLSPSGPSGTIHEMEITSNPIIPRKVDQVVEEGAKAFQAASELYSARIDVDHISRLLSLGLLGEKRKLVPTRWSITASDDMVGRTLTEKVLDMPLLSDCLLFSGERLGNHFEILLMPLNYRFEVVEIWMPHSAWSEGEAWIGSDGEGLRGKQGYSSLAGGYYAARLAALEGLLRMGRQAAVLALREIGPSYWAPLGVWVVREAARAAMASLPQRFSTIGEALSAAAARMQTPMRDWRPYAKSLSQPSQTTLAGFL